MYDIIYKNKNIGSLKATYSTKGDKTIYHTSSTIGIKIIKQIDVNYTYEVSMENNLLKKANVDILVNGKQHAKTNTHWQENKYLITKNNKVQDPINTTIKYSTILLYFIEPMNITKCYSEQDGSFNSITSLGNHTYKKTNSKGKENNYTYKNGILESAIVDGGIIEFEMKLRH
ncbi:hypothetical protein KO500_10035 [Cellulophaga baltica]|nr:hypothetical protein [Cellulophaga baltica]